MFARTSDIQHPAGLVIRTPLLVPSFSSRGFGFSGKPEARTSEVSGPLEYCSAWLTETMLVSAYDLHHGHVPCMDRWPAELVFVDSGGYETGGYQELSALYVSDDPPKPWDEASLRCVLDHWPVESPAVFVSFDHPNERAPLGEQIARAKELFARYPSQVHDFLIKPETHDQQYIKVESVKEHIAQLAGFHVIGVTEKELGNSQLKRLKSIVRIRGALDDAGISAPLHVFGGLDPLSSIMYFIAGAEVFDGLTWLRYSYHEGKAIYRMNYGSLALGINTLDQQVFCKAWTDNVSYLQHLQLKMRYYPVKGDLAVFEELAKPITRAYETLCGDLGRAI